MCVLDLELHKAILFTKWLTFNYTFKLELYIDHLLDQGGVDRGGSRLFLQKQKTDIVVISL